jgi:hypothetical protein
MKPDRAAKHFIVAFLLALVGYIVCYQSIEHRRTRHGPWQVAFTRTVAGEPAIVINQPKLGITNVQIGFAGQRVPPISDTTILVFAAPHPVPFDVPFGKCVFMDTTFLPGTVTLSLFGHEIELLPRTLVIDRQDYPWPSGTTRLLPRLKATTAQTNP